MLGRRLTYVDAKAHEAASPRSHSLVSKQVTIHVSSYS